MTILPTCPREDCTATEQHWHDGGRGGWGRAVTCHPSCAHNGEFRCYAPRTPQPKPAAVGLPTVDEAARVISEAWANPSSVGSVHLIAAQAVLHLIAACLPVAQTIDPADVRVGDRVRIEYSGLVDKAPTDDGWTISEIRDRRFYLIDRPEPAEPEDPALAVVRRWLDEYMIKGNPTADGRDLLARIDAARADA